MGCHSSNSELNQQSLDQLAQRIVDGSYSALFPEGISHDAPFIQQLKTGAARIFCAARAQASEERCPWLFLWDFITTVSIVFDPVS